MYVVTNEAGRAYLLMWVWICSLSLAFHSLKIDEQLGGRG